MNSLVRFYKRDPFLKKEKDNDFFKKILNLTYHHYKNSKIYKLLLDKFNFKFKNQKCLENLPSLPVSLFKELDLISVPHHKIIKTLYSSGTSGEGRSKIFLDKINSSNQIQTLNSIMKKFLGKNRLPMLIIDKNPQSVINENFTAKSAAFYGFSIFGKKYTYLLCKNNKINYNLLNEFLKKYHKQKFLIFGFTSFVYENLIKKINPKLLKFDMSNALLLHGGGWKRMEEKKYQIKFLKKKF